MSEAVCRNCGNVRDRHNGFPNGIFCPGGCGVWEQAKPKVSTEPDMVNKPPHYNQHSIEPITVIEDWNMGYMDGQVLKYISRWRYKNGLEDLKKAQWYLNRLIENEGKKVK